MKAFVRLQRFLLYITLFSALIPSFAATTYTVRSGDSLSGIAQNHPLPHVSSAKMIEAIKIINENKNPSIKKNVLLIGQRLSIPTTHSELQNAIHLRHIFKKASTTHEPSMRSNAKKLITYTVKQGDSLWSIALKHSLTHVSNSNITQAIKGLNAKKYPAINDNSIRIGQKLLIPTGNRTLKKGLALYTSQHKKYLNYSAHPTVKNHIITNDSIPSQSKQNSSIKKISLSNSNSQIEPENISNRLPVNPPLIISQHREAASSNSATAWILFLLIAIVGLLIWRRFKRLKTQPSQQKHVQKINTQKIKEDFYQKGLSTWLLLKQLRPSSSDQNNTRQIKENFYNNNINMAPVLTKKQQNSVADTPPPPLAKNTTSLLLQEADKLIQTHEISKAKGLLQEALNKNPKNLAIRIKLLAVYGADGDQISFNSERDYLAAKLLPYDDQRWKEIDKLYRKYFGFN